MLFSLLVRQSKEPWSSFAGKILYFLRALIGPALVGKKDWWFRWDHLVKNFCCEIFWDWMYQSRNLQKRLSCRSWGTISVEQALFLCRRGKFKKSTDHRRLCHIVIHRDRPTVVSKMTNCEDKEGFYGGSKNERFWIIYRVRKNRSLSLFSEKWKS